MAGQRIIRPSVARILTFLVGLALAGYASSSLSRRSAEQVTANRIAAELGTRDVYVIVGDPSNPGDPSVSADVLTRAGFAVRRCQPGGGVFECFPWASVSRARVLGPFLVEIEWGQDSAGLSGYGARTRY